MQCSSHKAAAGTCLWFRHLGRMQSLLRRTCRREAGYLGSTWQACCQSALPQRVCRGSSKWELG